MFITKILKIKTAAVVRTLVSMKIAELIIVVIMTMMLMIEIMMIVIIEVLVTISVIMTVITMTYRKNSTKKGKTTGLEQRNWLGKYA